MKTTNNIGNIVPGSLIELSGEIYEVSKITRNEIYLCKDAKLKKTIQIEKIPKGAIK